MNSQIFQELNEIEKYDDTLLMLYKIKDTLVNIESTDVKQLSIMQFLQDQPDLISVDISGNDDVCANVESCIASMTGDVEVSQEELITLATLFAVALFAMKASFLLPGVIIATRKVAKLLEKQSTKNDALIAKGLRDDARKTLGFMNKSIMAITYNRFIKFVTDVDKAYDYLKRNIEKWDKSHMERMRSMIKTAGLSWNGKKHYQVVVYERVKMTLKESGWTRETVVKGHEAFKRLSTNLNEYGALSKQLERDVAHAHKKMKKDPDVDKVDRDRAKQEFIAIRKELTSFVKISTSVLKVASLTLRDAIRIYLK